MYTTRRATIGHFLHHSGHGPCDDGPSIRPASSYRVKSSKRVLSSGDYFYFCNRKNKLVGGRIHILWIDYDPKSILKFLVFWDTERHTRRLPPGSRNGARGTALPGPTSDSVVRCSHRDHTERAAHKPPKAGNLPPPDLVSVSLEMCISERCECVNGLSGELARTILESNAKRTRERRDPHPKGRGLH